MSAIIKLMLTQSRIIFIPIALWFVAWGATQGIFMNEHPQQLPVDINISALAATAWVLIVTAAALWLLPSYRRASLPRSKLLWLYLIPAILLIALPWHYSLLLNVWVFIPMIVITVFWQDYLTFGLLQTHLAKKTSPTRAAIITAIVFLLGHLVFFLDDMINPQFLLIGLAGFLFAFSRRWTGGVYIANVIHLVFYLL